MSNMTIKFWHTNNSAQTTDVPARESSLTVGSLRSTFYLASSDAQELFNAMWNKGMRPTTRMVTGSTSDARCDCGAKVGSWHLPACEYSGIVWRDEDYSHE